MKKTTIPYRHELKYRISRGSYEILRGRLKAVMRPDEHARDGRYRVTSLYFDDVYRSAYRDKLSGVLNRKKFRVRTYGLDPSTIRLEEKRKDGDVGYKKTALLTPEEYRLLLKGETAFLTAERFAGTAGEDFLWSSAAVRLLPSVVVDYVREPYTCTAGNVRITFDLALSAGGSLDLFDPAARYIPAFPDGEVILEVKYDRFLPSYIEEVLSGVPLLSESISKFILCSDCARLARYGC
ncbi:MAG: polyphosphate polymerase domain-containing protein [Bacteroides sp.]|nr:polyphosphate polymerase domain-containing protein [Eubacterium sp.]MCM1418989.1 polyphosphate polymerase domain-containing protein [Roseburia sp.]MCM1463117.1 polyphosphate polymerase domain-containing protein [Bacteroides sp.]